MELAFKTRKLRTLCEDRSKAASAFGDSVADALRTRLADLRAVTFVADLPTGRPEVVEREPPQLRFPLRDGSALLTRVSHRATPRTVDGSLDLERVRRLVVLEVCG